MSSGVDLVKMAQLFRIHASTIFKALTELFGFSFRKGMES